MISPGSIDDAGRAFALLLAAVPDRVDTPEGLAYVMTAAHPEDHIVYFRAEADSELIGWAVAGLEVFAPVRTAAFAGIVVHPAHRGKGVGSALYEVLESHVARIGARRIVVHSQGDAASDAFAARRRALSFFFFFFNSLEGDAVSSHAFAARRGFRLEGSATRSALDPRSVDPLESTPSGIEVVPLSRFADDPEAVFTVDREGALDEPGAHDYSGMTYESWRRWIWDHPDLDHALGVAALAGGTMVGTSLLMVDRRSRRAVNAGTGVLREFRGRGIGLAMKVHSLRCAAAAGITRVVTDNDDTNAPMLAINSRLGYEQSSVGRTWILER